MEVASVDVPATDRLPESTIFAEAKLVVVALVIVALVPVNEAIIPVVKLASDANRFVEVAFVIVPFVAVRFRTDKIFAQRVERTFKLVIDDEAIVEVESVVVPVTFNVPVALIFVAARLLVIVAFEIVATGTVRPEMFRLAMLAVPIVVEAIVEVDTVEVPVKVEVVLTVKLATVVVAAVVVANVAVPVAVKLLATNAPVVVALVPVALVHERLATDNKLAQRVLSTLRKVIDEEATVEVESVEVPVTDSVPPILSLPFILVEPVVVEFVIVALVAVRV